MQHAIAFKIKHRVISPTSCQACSFGYATSTCKKRCPGYDGVRVETVCSGNGVCNMGIDGTGRCLWWHGWNVISGWYNGLYKDV